MQDVVIASACRSAIGKFMGGLSSFRAPELGGLAVAEAIRRAGISPEAVDEVILGCVLQAGLGQNPARQAAIAGGVPVERGAFTVNKVCGSGLKSVALAAQAIRAGDADVIVAGGMESMSNAPYLLPEARRGQRLGHAKVIDAMIHDGLWDIYNDFHMGMTGELVAREFDISRERQDRFAAHSHEKAVAAQAEGKFQAEIFPVEVPQRKGDPVVFDTDEGPRSDSTQESLARLRPAFDKEGSVTAGNASSINDGASALVVMSAKKAEALGVQPLARIIDYASGGMKPEWVMMAPKNAVENLEKKTSRKTGSYDLIEVNEAFSVASCALIDQVPFEASRVNVNGGAVALGHPIGASGARILTTLLYAMKDSGAQTGLATLCLGGGNAVALSVERL